jgi:hypothetical protein
MKVYLATDPECFTVEKVKEGQLGGAESFFLILRKWLKMRGHNVFTSGLGEVCDSPDVVIHSNSSDFTQQGKCHILWAGSWHAPVSDPRFDEVIVLSEYMRQKMGCERAFVIPAPYGKDLEIHKGVDFDRYNIVTTANPNRWFPLARDMARTLMAHGITYSWQYSGGNKLYKPYFPECYGFDQDGIIYRGILSRNDLLGMLTLAHVWIYPGFRDVDETFCLSMIEAAYLGIPVIVPNKEPFRSVLPEAFLVESFNDMIDKVIALFKYGPDRINYNMDRYSERVVMPQYVRLIEAKK